MEQPGWLAPEQRRMERLLAEDRRWSHAEWKRHYLDHPLKRSVARRLLWQCEVAGVWVTGVPTQPAGSLFGIDGAPLPIRDRTRMRLWHPLHVDLSELASWRRLLPERRFRQPFPQLFRRVYVAGLSGEAHPFLSDRLAGYLLPWGAALRRLRARGWRQSGPLNLRGIGRLDREVGGTGIRAELLLTAVWDHDGVGELRAPTLRFRRREGDGHRGVDLIDVPPLVFSETLYDIGLLVETHAVGFDPRWRAQQGAFSLSPRGVALSSDVLLRVITRLGIAGRCAVSGQFLDVRGDRGSYRISLVDAEVLMEPGGRSLCLAQAPDVAQASDVLPFREQDHLLSLVVSKAVLLANDTRIHDPSIIRQLSSFS